MTDQDPRMVAPRGVNWKKRLVMLGGALAAVVLCIAARVAWGPAGAVAQGPTKGASAKSATKQPPQSPVEGKLGYVAAVNGQRITRDDLARECLMHYGKEVLESLTNKYLISEHCKQRGVTVTTKEVDAEIDRMAERFGLPTDQWLKMLEEERNITPQQYARDIVWPTIALRKLAAQKVEPTKEEIQAAYETQFGPAVQARLIACNTEEKAKDAHAKAVKNPDDFGNLAKELSDDTNSASAKGIIQPIRMHLGDPTIEKVAFGMRPGEVSPILKVANQFVILKCEAQIPARPMPMEQVERLLTDAVRDKKLRLVADQVFKGLQDASAVEVIYGDAQKSQQLPGVAAKINGRTIGMQELAEECIERHGVEVLSGTINRRLLEIECQRRNIVIAKPDIDAEVARAAESMGKHLPNKQPDIAGWLKSVEEDQGMPVDLYIHDVVWPSVALKKLVGDNVKVTDEDLRKGYEANYGPRVRCRAIVLNQQRRAQEVWDMARKRPTPDYFGQLAAEYSIEAGSRALEGEVPPIQRHGGQPMLEEEAFSLKPGELSGIIQVDDKFVILFCEGYTQPTPIKFNEVRDEIFKDIHEKKLRIAMAEQFTKIQENSHIDNFLTGTVQSSKQDRELLKAVQPRGLDAELDAIEKRQDRAVRPASATGARSAPPRR